MQFAAQGRGLGEHGKLHKNLNLYPRILNPNPIQNPSLIWKAKYEK